MGPLINRLLHRFGLEVRRLPPPRTDPPLDPGEIAELERLLAAFANSRPNGDDLADAAALRSYLSDERITFYNETLRVVQEMGVELSGQRVADFGCGPGYMLRLIAQHAEPSELTGYDTFVEMNELARMLCPHATIHDLAIRDIEDVFDVVFCMEVLEHFVDPADALRELAHCAAPSGTLVLTVPDGRLDQHPALALRDDGSAYWGHINFWSPENWPIFLRSTLGDAAHVQTGRVGQDKLIGIVRPSVVSSLRE